MTEVSCQSPLVKLLSVDCMLTAIVHILAGIIGESDIGSVNGSGGCGSSFNSMSIGEKNH